MRCMKLGWTVGFLITQTSLYLFRPLMEDRTSRRMMKDVVGKIVSARRVRFHGFSFDIVLKDSTGCTIKLRIWEGHGTNRPGVIMRAIGNKAKIYISWVKLVHRGSNNFLMSTVYSNLVVYPDVYEAYFIH